MDVVRLGMSSGYNLGELNLWCKMTVPSPDDIYIWEYFPSRFNIYFTEQVFESGTRVPFMVRVPGSPSNGQRTSALVEAVDLYVFCLLLVLPLLPLPLPLPLLRRRRQD